MRDQLLNMRSFDVFRCVQLPDNTGQHSWAEMLSFYNHEMIDLPTLLVEAVSTGQFSEVNPSGAGPFPARPTMPNTAQGTVGGARVCALLQDRLLYLKSLIAEVRNIMDLLHLALGGFDTEEYDPAAVVGLNLADASPQLNPWSAYLLRALVRMRIADVDFRVVSRDVESILQRATDVHRGVLVPAVPMTPNDMSELAHQYRAWESIYLEIDVEWFGLCSGIGERTIFYRDQQRRRQFTQWRNGLSV